MQTVNVTTSHDYYKPIFDDLNRLDKFDLIVDILNVIIKHLPPNALSYDLICYGYFKAKQYMKAIEWGERALAVTTNPVALASIRFNLSKCYTYANFPEKAERCLRLNTMFNPNDTSSHIDYAVSIYGMNRKEESEQILLKCLDMGNFANPKDEDIIRFNLGAHEIRKGNFKQGMKLLSMGRYLCSWGSTTHNFPIPQWDGKSRAGSTILIVGEGGIGDEIINSRFVKHLLQRGMIPSWASAHGLKDIFSRLPFQSTQNYKNFTSDIDNIKQFDYWAPAMNLPMLLDIDIDQLWYGPYLTTNQQYVDKWNWMNNSNRVKVGIRWSGNPLYEQDLHRTIPLDKVYEIVNQYDVDIYSLQRDAGADDVYNYPNMIDLQHKFETLEDTIAAINNLDVVITSCTSVAHIAAAMDKKVFILLPVMTYYLWCNEKPHSEWYSNNVTLLRQDKPRDWSKPLNELKQALPSLLSQQFNI